MQAAVEFKGVARNVIGKGAARAARREGKVPVVLYAHNKESVHADIDANQLTQAYIKGGFMNKIVSVEVNGKTYFGIPREVQTHPVSDQIEHADFQQVDAKSEVKVFVPVHVSGADKSIGMKRGGVLNIVSHQVALLCQVTKIPASIELDVTDLNINSSIHLSDISLPEGVRPANKRVNVTIVSISGRAADEEPAAGAGAGASDVPASTAKAPAAAPAAKK